jgi:hypothetical protein
MQSSEAAGWRVSAIDGMIRESRDVPDKPYMENI